MTDTKRRIRLILHGKAAKRLDVRAAVGVVREQGYDVQVRVTWEAGDAIRMAAEAMADEVDTLVAGGGDGTLNEVVSGALQASERPCSVGLIPLGTANDFAHCCGVPIDNPTAALQLVAATRPRPIDIGRVDDKIFVNLASGGFGTRVTVETPAEFKKALGKVSYLLTGLTKFGQFGAEHGRLKGPGFEWEGPIVALAVGNGRQAGGGIQLCPEALLDDGLLDVTVLPEGSKAERSELLQRLVQEGIAALDRAVITARLPWLEVEVPQGLYVNLDGEPVRRRHYRFEAESGRLLFHLPESAPLLGAAAIG